LLGDAEAGLPILEAAHAAEGLAHDQEESMDRRRTSRVAAM
jgi:hypothetical protein